MLAEGRQYRATDYEIEGDKNDRGGHDENHDVPEQSDEFHAESLGTRQLA